MGLCTVILDGKFNYPSVLITDIDNNHYLFDCGEGTNSRKTANRIKAIFLSHHHVDHFLGFDRVISHNIFSENQLNVYGPEKTIDRVVSKVKAYDWNLAEKSDALKLRIHDLTNSGIISSSVNVPSGLENIEKENNQFSEKKIILNENLTVHYTLLNHKIPSVAYSFSENDSIKIDKEKLKKLEIKKGPWIGELKDKYAQPEAILSIGDGRTYQVKDFADLIVPVKGKKIVYASDFIFSEENLKQLIEIGENADIFYCEANFLSEDEIKAAETYHLTAEQAGKIASKAKVKELRLFHHSRKHIGQEELFIEEASKYFKGPIK